jgi:hypothetical protein
MVHMAAWAPGNEDRHDVLDGDQEQDFVLSAPTRADGDKGSASTPVPINVWPGTPSLLQRRARPKRRYRLAGQHLPDLVFAGLAAGHPPAGRERT